MQKPDNIKPILIGVAIDNASEVIQSIHDFAHQFPILSVVITAVFIGRFVYHKYMRNTG
ncbi:hypothetical protein [Bacillus cereus]|uniref:hypothetical protein n=1 Tax=Bacillus cereus TaxID=1396 RepID=UPI00178C81DF|nr:hypothetical protein [Bacillus cereus]